MDITAKILITIEISWGIVVVLFYMLGLFAKKEKYKNTFSTLAMIFFAIFWIVAFIGFYVAVWRF